MSDLIRGDILFRWLQTQELESILQKNIVAVQRQSITTQRTWALSDQPDLETIKSRLRAIPSYFWAERIGHVGIYGGDNKVIEVGQGHVGGLGDKKAKKRENTDVVVRFPTDVAQRIAKIAKDSLGNENMYMYPFNKLFNKEIAGRVVEEQFPRGTRRTAKKKLAEKAQEQKKWAGGTGYGTMVSNPTNPVYDLWRRGMTCSKGANVFKQNWPILKEQEARVARTFEKARGLLERGKHNRFNPRREYYIGVGKCEPVCSHFVHAVIYAAVVPGGTVYAATCKETEHIFNVSPNMLWHYFWNDLGVFRGQEAEFCGVQKEGKIDQEKTGEFQELMHNPQRKVA